MSDQTMTVSIRAACLSDFPHLVEFFTTTFCQDPGFRRLVSSEDELREMFAFQLPHLTVDVAVQQAAVGDDSRTPICGAAAWVSPDGTYPQWNTQKARAREQVTEQYHPDYGHWYLYMIAASTPRRGVGSALMEYGLERAANYPVYLEATSVDSARLYERFGFVPTGYIPCTDSEPPELGMLR